MGDLRISSEERVSKDLEALRLRASEFVDKEANLRILNDLDHGRTHLELLLMQFAVSESKRTAIACRDMTFAGGRVQA